MGRIKNLFSSFHGSKWAFTYTLWTSSSLPWKKCGRGWGWRSFCTQLSYWWWRGTLGFILAQSDFFFPPVASENVAIVIRRKDLPSRLLMSLSHLILSARLTIPWTPSLPFTFFMQPWGGWVKDVVDDWRACKPRRKGFCLSCEWFSLGIGTLDKSSFLALVIVWK